MDTNKQHTDDSIIVREEQRFTYSKATRILLSDSRITNFGILAMIGLGMHTNDVGSCYPTIKTLCQWSRLSPNSLRKGLKELEDCGYLDIEYRKNPDNPKENLPNLYTVFPYHKSLHRANAPGGGVQHSMPQGVPHEVKEGTSPHEGGVPHEVKGNYTHSNNTHQLTIADSIFSELQVIRHKGTEEKAVTAELNGLTADEVKPFIAYLKKKHTGKEDVYYLTCMANATNLADFRKGDSSYPNIKLYVPDEKELEPLTADELEESKRMAAEWLRKHPKVKEA